MKIESEKIHSPFTGHLERISGEVFANCYQCGNCTGGCPVSFAMDYGPGQIIRLLQLGQEELVVNSNTMLLCVGCLQCYSRCPKGISAASILEALRLLCLRRGEDQEDLRELPFPFLKKAPQQAIVSGCRKFVS